MRRVYLGSNSSGKTRLSSELAHKFQDEGLIVVSNLPEFSSNNLATDPLKKLALEQSGIYKDVAKYHNYIEAVFINNILDILCKEGDVLLLDDIDSHMTSTILNNIIDLLMVDPEPEEFDPKYPELWRLWKHVIITGYATSLALITEDDFSKREVHYVSEDGKETVVVGGEDIGRCILHST